MVEEDHERSLRNNALALVKYVCELILDAAKLMIFQETSPPCYHKHGVIFLVGCNGQRKVQR